jgi:hypothetical protein
MKKVLSNKTFKLNLMKNIIITLILLISFTAIKAQKIISLDSTSFMELAFFLEKNNFKVLDIDYKTIKIATKDQLHFIYLDVSGNNFGVSKYLLINAQFRLNDNAQESQIQNAIGKINASKMIKGFHIQDKGQETINDIKIEYPFWIEKNFVGENLVNAIKEFDTFISSQSWVTDNIF